MRDNDQLTRLTEISELAQEINGGLADVSNAEKFDMSACWTLSVTQDRARTLQGKIEDMMRQIAVDRADKEKMRKRRARNNKNISCL